MAAGVDGLAPRSVRTGSPGARWTSAKTTKDIAMRSGMACASRMAMNFRIPLSNWSCPQIPVKPFDAPPPGIEAMLALVKAVALARVDHQFRRDAAFPQRGVEFLRLPERSAAVLGALDQKGRGDRIVEPHQGGALHRDPAVLFELQRAAVDEFMEV